MLVQQTVAQIFLDYCFYLSLAELERYRVYEFVDEASVARSSVLLGVGAKSRMAYLSNKERNRRKHAQSPASRSPAAQWHWLSLKNALD